jgi:hypothetical protein
MNLVLIRGGYPPVAVRPADRLAYLSALQEAQENSNVFSISVWMRRWKII